MHETQDEALLIEAILASGVKIPPIPEVLLKLNTMLHDPDAGPRQLADIVRHDGASSGALFRLAASPVFGLRARVDTVDKAATVLGMKNAVATVRGAALRAALQSPEHARALEAVWARSNAIAEQSLAALRSRRIAAVNSEMAYTLGLFHDCGLGLLIRRFPVYGQALAPDAVWPDLVEIDRQAGAHHGMAGQMVARSWLLQEELGLAIRHHHDPQAMQYVPEEVARLCAVLAFATHLHNVQTLSDDREWDAGWRSEAARSLTMTDQDLTGWETATLDPD